MFRSKMETLIITLQYLERYTRIWIFSKYNTQYFVDRHDIIMYGYD